MSFRFITTFKGAVVRLRCLLGCVVAASVLATSPTLPFEDLWKAYALGNVSEARVLAEKYIDQSERELKAARLDWEKLDAAGKLTRAVGAVASYEARYPTAGRFRNASPLEAQLVRAVETMEAVPFPESRRALIQGQIGDICHNWLAAAVGRKTEAERAAFLRAHMAALRAVGIDRLDHPKLLGRMGAAVTGEDERRLRELVAGEAYMVRELECVLIYLPGRVVDRTVSACGPEHGPWKFIGPSLHR